MTDGEWNIYESKDGGFVGQANPCKFQDGIVLMTGSGSCPIQHPGYQLTAAEVKWIGASGIIRLYDHDAFVEVDMLHWIQLLPHKNQRWFRHIFFFKERKDDGFDELFEDCTFTHPVRVLEVTDGETLSNFPVTDVRFIPHDNEFIIEAVRATSLFGLYQLPRSKAEPSGTTFALCIQDIDDAASTFVAEAIQSIVRDTKHLGLPTLVLSNPSLTHDQRLKRLKALLSFGFTVFVRTGSGSWPILAGDLFQLSSHVKVMTL